MADDLRAVSGDAGGDADAVNSDRAGRAVNALLHNYRHGFAGLTLVMGNNRVRP